MSKGKRQCAQRGTARRRRRDRTKHAFMRLKGAETGANRRRDRSLVAVDGRDGIDHAVLAHVHALRRNANRTQTESAVTRDQANASTEACRGTNAHSRSSQHSRPRWGSQMSRGNGRFEQTHVHSKSMSGHSEGRENPNAGVAMRVKQGLLTCR